VVLGHLSLVIGHWSLVIGHWSFDMASQPFEKLEVFRLAERIADAIWPLVLKWNGVARDTIGKQLVRAADSIGANIAEGAGRGSFQDNRRFVRIARGSLFETRFWLRRAHARQLLASEDVEQLKPLIDELGPRLNAYLRSIGPRAKDQ
jgi:four helix bundle protein